MRLELGGRYFVMRVVVMSGLIMVVAQNVMPHETGRLGLVAPAATANSTLSNVITVWRINALRVRYLAGNIFVTRYVVLRGVILVAIQCPFPGPVM